MANVFIALRRLLLIAALIVAPQAAWAADPLPLSAYGNLPDVERVALSHSGERVAAVMASGGKRALLLMDAELEVLRTMPLTSEKVRSMEWIGDDRLVIVVSQTETLGPEFVQSQIEFFHAIIVPADAAAERRVVFDKDPTMLNMVFGTYGVRQVDGRWVAYLGGVE